MAEKQNILAVKSVLVDTSFLIRLLKANDEYHKNCREYWEFFLNQKISIYLSTIVVSEYGVQDNPSNLPLKQMRVLPFNFTDACLAGRLRAELIAHNKFVDSGKRIVVINDIKIFAQISNNNIDAYITKDTESIKIYNNLRTSLPREIKMLDLTVPLNNLQGSLFAV